MSSERELSRKTPSFEMMIFVLILAAPRETEEATYFYQYDQRGNHTLNCSQSATEYVWYRGQDSSSLQAFEPMSRNQSQNSPCAADSRYTEKILGLPASSAGGIFACAARAKEPKCPLFTNSSHCSSFDFFIVAIRNGTEEQKVFQPTPEQSDSIVNVTEKGNFTLICEFQIKNNSEFAMYWIKETTPSVCLFSAANDDYHSRNVSYDVNCCVDVAVKERRADRSDFQGQPLRHNLTIFNASSSDSGTYLCVVSTWANKRLWKIARNVSVEVRNSTLPRNFTTENTASNGGTFKLALMCTKASHFTKELKISLGVIGGVLLICGILGLLCWKKAKGNPVEKGPRNQAEVEMEEGDCSPYAVSSRNDIDKIETMYSVVTYPPEPQQDASALTDGQAASRSGKEVHTVYAVVSK